MFKLRVGMFTMPMCSITCINPLQGAIPRILLRERSVGAGAESISGARAHVGIADAFVEELAATLKPGSSALFVLVRKVDPARVLEELKGFGGKVLQTSLASEDATRLQEALDASKTGNDA